MIVRTNRFDIETAENKGAFLEMNRLGALGVPFLFVIDFDARFPLVMPLSEASDAGILFDLNGVTNSQCVPLPRTRFSFAKQPVDYETYARAFEKVVARERAGDSYLVNLTFPTRVFTDLSLREIFHASVAQYRFYAEDRFVVFSPERFVRIENGIISTFPMKGTIDASIPNAKRILEDDEKEAAEHLTVVDLLRNDLNTVARGIRVERFRFFSEIETNGKRILQTSSHVSGDLEAGYERRIGSIIERMLPAGSVTGAPKKKTVEIIRDAETDSRGYYTGVFGWSNGAFLESAVMIRFIELVDGAMYARSGGGITIYSDPQSEYAEMVDKVYLPLRAGE